MVQIRKCAGFFLINTAQRFAVPVKRDRKAHMRYTVTGKRPKNGEQGNKGHLRMGTKYFICLPARRF